MTLPSSEPTDSQDNADPIGENWTAHNTQGVRGWAVAVAHPSQDGSFYAPIAQGLSEAEAKLLAAAPRLKEELENLRDSTPENWESPSDFIAWTQSRLEKALNSI